MAKVKTKRAAAKRFKINGSGKIKRGQAYKRHILTKKSTKRKRQLRTGMLVNASDIRSVKNVLNK